MEILMAIGIVVYLVIGGLVAKLALGEIEDAGDYMIAGLIAIFWPLVAIVGGIGLALGALWNWIIG